MVGIKTVGRWIGVIPVAILGLFLGGIISNILFDIQAWFSGASPDSGMAMINHWILSSAISSGAAVYFGARVAPSNRKIVAMVLGALMVAGATVTVIYAISKGQNVIWYCLSAIAAVIAAGVVIYWFFENGEDFTLSD